MLDFSDPLTARHAALSSAKRHGDREDFSAHNQHHQRPYHLEPLRLQHSGCLTPIYEATSAVFRHYSPRVCLPSKPKILIPLTCHAEHRHPNRRPLFRSRAYQRNHSEPRLPVLPEALQTAQCALPGPDVPSSESQAGTPTTVASKSTY